MRSGLAHVHLPARCTSSPMSPPTACLIAAAHAFGGPVLRNALYSATSRRDPSWTDGSAAYLPINLLNVLDTFPATGSTQYALGSFTRAAERHGQRLQLRLPRGRAGLEVS